MFAELIQTAVVITQIDYQVACSVLLDLLKRLLKEVVKRDFAVRIYIQIEMADGEYGDCAAVQELEVGIRRRFRISCR